MNKIIYWTSILSSIFLHCCGDSAHDIEVAYLTEHKKIIEEFKGAWVTRHYFEVYGKDTVNQLSTHPVIVLFDSTSGSYISIGYSLVLHRTHNFVEDTFWMIPDQGGISDYTYIAKHGENQLVLVNNLETGEYRKRKGKCKRYYCLQRTSFKESKVSTFSEIDLYNQMFQGQQGDTNYLYYFDHSALLAITETLASDTSYDVEQVGSCWTTRFDKKCFLTFDYTVLLNKHSQNQGERHPHYPPYQHFQVIENSEDALVLFDLLKQEELVLQRIK